MKLKRFALIVLVAASSTALIAAWSGTTDLTKPYAGDGEATYEISGINFSGQVWLESPNWTGTAYRRTRWWYRNSHFEIYESTNHNRDNVSNTFGANSSDIHTVLGEAELLDGNGSSQGNS
jgi:hypothetical protein